MNKQAELDKLDRSIRDGEIRLRTLQTNIESLEQEIGTLSNLQVQLEENVKCLKKNNVVAIAKEFKKAKEDLAKTKTRLVAIKSDVDHFKKLEKEGVALIKKAKEDLEKIKKLGDDNVLRATFKRKSDG